MRGWVAWIVAVGIACVGSPAAAEPVDALVSETISGVHSMIYRGDTADLALPEFAWSSSGPSKWISLADMPADLRTRTFATYALFAVDIDATGHSTDCRVVKPSADARLDRIACAGILRASGFEQRWTAPGKPGAYPSLLYAGWRTRLKSDTPIAPTGGLFSRSGSYSGWPRLKWLGGVRIDRFPDLQALHPPFADGVAGTVGLDLVVDPNGDNTCMIRASSLYKALDDAACAVARHLTVSFSSAMCADCRRVLPLKIFWKRKGSFIRVPLVGGPLAEKPIPRDPADREPVSYREKHLIRTASLSPDFQHLTDRRLSNPIPLVSVSVDNLGTIRDCRILVSSGNKPVDAQLCMSVKARVIITPQTDIFGTAPEATEIRLPIKLDLPRLAQQVQERAAAVPAAP